MRPEVRAVQAAARKNIHTPGRCTADVIHVFIRSLRDGEFLYVEVFF